MDFARRDFLILKMIIKDEFNHEFHPLMNEIKSKLSIKVSKVTLFFILIIYQYALIFLLLLLFYNMRNSSLFILISILIAAFNLILPATIARTSQSRIEENPNFECLRMSKLPLNKSKKIIIFSELINFWIHNFYIEFLTIWLLFIQFKAIGLLMGVMWLIIVSAVFLKILMKKSDINGFNTDSIAIYLFQLVLGAFVAYNIFEIFVATLDRLSLNQFFDVDILSDYAKNYLQNIIIAFKSRVWCGLLAVIIFVVVYAFIRLFISRIELKKMDLLKEAVIAKFINITIKITNNIFVKRDLKRIFNIMLRLEINIFMVIIPSGIVFISAAFYFFITSNMEPTAVLIALDFILWAALYQFSNLLVQKIPIFNIASELRNIEIIKMSNKGIGKLINSKHILLFIFNIPLLLIIIFGKVILLFMGINPIIVLLSLVNNFGMLIVCLLLTLKWTLILPKFSWTNIFMIRQDNFDTQILRQFLLVPSRVITLFFIISFVFVNIVNVEYDVYFVFLYYILSSIGILIMILLLKRRKENEYNAKI